MLKICWQAKRKIGTLCYVSSLAASGSCRAGPRFEAACSQGAGGVVWTRRKGLLHCLDGLIGFFIALMITWC